MALDTGTQVLSTTAIQLPSQPCTRVNITNNDASISILIGWTQAKQSLTVPPLGGKYIRTSNLNRIWAKSASGTPTLSYMTE